MASDSSKKPVILIGLGGIGSRIVDDVYSRVDEQRKKQVTAVVLDTDSGDLSKLKNVETRIQTAPKINIGAYVAKNPEVMEWFPYEHKIITSKMMQAGAGQIRAVSRLALYSAIQEGKLSKLDKEINKLFENSDSDFGENTGIIIVGSITGGTSAGSFIQIGMYIRDYFRKYMPGISVNINGVFVLPDVLIKNNLLPNYQHDRIRANAYASLKELNATLSQEILDKHTLYLEYKPNMGDKAISATTQPYNSVTFFDYENSDGQHLPSFADYHKQIVDAIHYGYIGPSSDKHYSILDNIIEIVIDKGGDAFYGGVSTAKLIYPYEDIMDYLNYEWISEEIDENWTRIDKEYEKVFKDYEKDFKKGLNPIEPKKSEIFIKTIDRVKDEENPNPFMNTLYTQTREYDERKKDIGGKAESFVKFIVEDHIPNILKIDEDYKRLKNATEYSDDIDKKETSKSSVEECEYTAEALYNSISILTKNYKRPLLNDILLSGCNGSREEKYSYTYWVSKNEAMHPLAIRYFLYKSEKLLKEKLDAIKADNKKSVKKIKKYHELFDPEPQDDYFKKPDEVLQEILDKNAIVSFLFNPFKDFIEQYKASYNEHVNTINKYAKNRLLEQTIEMLLEYIEKMLKGWDSFFELLKKDIKQDIEEHKKSLLIKHERNGSDIFVFASKEAKKALWEDNRASLVGLDVSDDISNAIFKSEYQHFCKKTENPKSKGTTKEEYLNILERAFKKLLIEKTESSLNIPIDDAIQKEDIHTLERYIKNMVNKNKPWVNADFQTGDAIKIWGIYDDKSLEEKLTPLRDGNIVSSDSYSKYEISYMIGFVPLSIHDFSKFGIKKIGIDQKQIGSYNKAYRKIIEGVEDNPDNSITPHIDKDWHEYLPDFNPDTIENEKNDFYRAFLVGLILDWLKSSSFDGETLYAYDTGNNLTKIAKKGKSVKGKKIIDLYKAIEVDPRVKKSINQRFKVIIEKSELDNDIDTHPFTEGLLATKESNILDILFALSGTNNARDREEILDAITFLRTLIEDFYIEVAGELGRVKARKYIDEVTKKMWENAKLPEEYRGEHLSIEWENRFCKRD